MRGLHRNRRLLYYAQLVAVEDGVDEWGNETGEPVLVYGEQTELWCNISGATGEEVMQAFGGFSDYSRVICVADAACPIDKNSVVWFGVTPDKPYNYVVVRKADSKNGVLYALREVAVGA